MILRTLLTFLIASATLAHSYHYLDCRSSLPPSWSLDNTYNYQSSMHCYEECSSKGLKYFALARHQECYCGNEIPLGGTSDSCDASCYGYKHEMCGGSSAYSVYSVGSDLQARAIADIAEGTASTDVEEVVVVSTVVQTVESGAVSAAASTTVAVTSTASQTSAASAVSQAATTSTASGTPSLSSPSQQNTQDDSSTSTTSPITSSASVALASSTQTSASSTTQSVVVSASQTLVPSTTTNADDITSIVYDTSYRTQNGSTIYQTVTQSSTATSSANSSSSSKHKNHVNVGAIVGGVVGGVGGAAVAAVLLLLLIRHFNKRREQERMEQEYQEAIKPVDFGNDKSPHVADSSILSLNHGPSSGSFDDDERSGALTNPFEDSGRINHGSVIREESPSNPKVLTVVNPDEQD